MGLAVSRQEAFWEACGFGDKIQVRKLIAEGIDVNWVSYTHNSCAIHVASQGKMEIVQMLINAKCNVTVRDDRGSTALHQAAMKGDSNVIRLLIKAGAEVDAQDKNGWTPLISAAYFCQLGAVETLLEHNASVLIQNQDQRSALHEACRSYSYFNEDNMAAIAHLLITAGSDINSKSSDKGEADFTPLMFCAYHNHPKVSQALVNAGCEINSQGSNKWSALHWAADRGNIEVARVLIMSGIDVLLRGISEELAVDRASTKDLYRLLVKCVEGASYNYHDPNRNTQEKLKDISDKIFQTADDHKNIVDKQLQLLDDEDTSTTHSTSTLHSTTPSTNHSATPSINHLSLNNHTTHNHSTTDVNSPTTDKPTYRSNQQHKYTSNSANRLSLILSNSVSPLSSPPTLKEAAGGGGGKRCGRGVGGRGENGGGEKVRANGMVKTPLKFICDEDDDVREPMEKKNGFAKGGDH